MITVAQLTGTRPGAYKGLGAAGGGPASSAPATMGGTLLRRLAQAGANRDGDAGAAAERLLQAAGPTKVRGQGASTSPALSTPGTLVSNPLVSAVLVRDQLQSSQEPSRRLDVLVDTAVPAAPPAPVSPSRPVRPPPPQRASPGPSVVPSSSVESGSAGVPALSSTADPIQLGRVGRGLRAHHRPPPPPSDDVAALSGGSLSPGPSPTAAQALSRALLRSARDGSHRLSRPPPPPLEDDDGAPV